MTGSAGRIVTIRVLEPDYCYGQGSIDIRVERIDRASPVRYDGEVWYRVEGMQVGPNGTELGRRQVLVRGRRLPPP